MVGAVVEVHVFQSLSSWKYLLEAELQNVLQVSDIDSFLVFVEVSLRALISASLLSYRVMFQSLFSWKYLLETVLE